jgi:ssDNA-binding Zn-finger/Zn-ribbon topoisomerase 1
METPSRCPRCKKVYIHHKRRWTGDLELAPFTCPACNQIEANLLLREAKLEEKLERQAKADAMTDIFEYEAEPTTYNLNSL